jgi:hypothetical protein
MSIETRNNVICILLAVLALALFIAIGGDDEAQIKAHSQWEANLKDQGAWVMW